MFNLLLFFSFLATLFVAEHILEGLQLTVQQALTKMSKETHPLRHTVQTHITLKIGIRVDPLGLLTGHWARPLGRAIIYATRNPIIRKPRLLGTT